MQISPIRPMNNRPLTSTPTFAKQKSQQVAFTGKINVIDSIAHFIGGKVLNNKVAERVVNKFKHTNLASHLSAFTGLTLSGFYVHQTLKSDSLEKKKKKTLAINQALVAILSTIGGYTLDNMTDEVIKKYVNKFKRINVDNPKLPTYIKGINTAKSLMIFGTMYRFIAPVIVTPIANWIGEQISKSKKSTQIKQTA